MDRSTARVTICRKQSSCRQLSALGPDVSQDPFDWQPAQELDEPAFNRSGVGFVVVHAGCSVGLGFRPFDGAGSRLGYLVVRLGTVKGVCHGCRDGGTLDEKAHLSVEVGRTRVKVERSDKDVFPIDREGLGVQARLRSGQDLAQ